MNSRSFLSLSLGLNLVLAIVLAWTLRRHAEPPASGSPGPSAVPSAQAVIPAAIQTSEVRQVTDSFQWAQLESGDYRVYIANLRAIGCPEETIRDIVTADVEELFSGRVAAIANSVTGQFWELMLHQKNLERMINDKEKELQALQTERRETLNMLFGENDSAMLVRQRTQDRENMRDQFEFLSEQKVAALEEIDHQFMTDSGALARETLSATERNVKQDELAARKDEQIKALLSDSEYAEYKLRTGAAANVRHQLVDLDVTEAEARTIALAKASGDGEARIRELLGSERYADYVRTSDAAYQQTVQITDRFDLSHETAVQVYELRKQAEVQMQEVSNDVNRTPEERAEILRAMRLETENSLATVLGPQVFKTYQKYGSQWLSRFSETTP